MENYMSNHTGSAPSSAERFEKMYPDAYTRVYPHVQYLVNSVGDESIHTMTNEDIDRITQEAMRRSNVINDPPAGHSMHTVGDLTRAMVVRDFHDRHRRSRFFPFFSPFFSPFFFFPFDDRDRFREFGERERDRDMDREHFR